MRHILSFCWFDGSPVSYPCVFRHVTRELPNNVPYAAKVSLIRDFQKTWEQSALACFDAVQRTIYAFLLAQIEQQFRQYGNLKAVVRYVTPPHVMLESH